MKKYIPFIALFFFHLNSYAECNLNSFRWECDVIAKHKPNWRAHTLVYCGNTQVFLTREQYDLVRRYQEADVNMVLNIKGRYVTGPCIVYNRHATEN